MVALGIVIAFLAATTAVMGIRLGGLKADRNDADTAREKSEKNLKTTQEAYHDYEVRTRKQLADLRDDIRELHVERLEHLKECAVPGDSARRIQRLFDKAADPTP